MITTTIIIKPVYVNIITCIFFSPYKSSVTFILCINLVTYTHKNEFGRRSKFKSHIIETT